MTIITLSLLAASEYTYETIVNLDQLATLYYPIKVCYSVNTYFENFLYMMNGLDNGTHERTIFCFGLIIIISK
jgi:hypothetical protein